MGFVFMRNWFIWGVAVVAFLALSTFLISSAPDIFFPQKDITLSSAEEIGFHLEARRLMAQILLSGGLVVICVLAVYHRYANMDRHLKIVHDSKLDDQISDALNKLQTVRLEVQLGGILMLERIAYEYKNQHWTIMELLTTYLREHAKVERRRSNDRKKGSLSKRRLSEDVQAILTVLGRRNWFELEAKHLKIINLKHCNFAGSDLRAGYFERTNFRGCNFENALLMDTRLAGAFLAEANLSRANLTGADLRGANLARANLRNAKLDDADLTDAILNETVLDGASFEQEQIESANLIALSNKPTQRPHREKSDLLEELENNHVSAPHVEEGTPKPNSLPVPKRVMLDPQKTSDIDLHDHEEQTIVEAMHPLSAFFKRS